MVVAWKLPTTFYAQRIGDVHTYGGRCSFVTILKDMNITKNLELVSIQEGKAVTSSLQVSQVFEMRHCDVLRAIRNLDCSKEYQERNFASKFYISDIGKGAQKKNPMYLMSKDGFTFLVMGFTGSKAAKFKEDYINAFNQMEQHIIQQSKPINPLPSPMRKYKSRKIDTYISVEENEQLKRLCKKHGYSSTYQLLQHLIRCFLLQSGDDLFIEVGHQKQIHSTEVKYLKEQIKILKDAYADRNNMLSQTLPFLEDMNKTIEEERARRKLAEQKLKQVQALFA